KFLASLRSAEDTPRSKLKRDGNRAVIYCSTTDPYQVYEPKAPAPSQRLATLRAAKQANLHVYVAVAPTYPECDETDLRATLKAIADLEPITIFHEPINVRAENVARMKAQANALGVSLKTEVF